MGSPRRRSISAHEVAPILKARCAECHTNGKYKGGVNLDSRGDLLKSKAALPGKSTGSKIFERISSKNPEERMPPKGEPLSAKQIELLKNWIDQGLPWEEGFTFKAPTYVAPLKPRRPTPPPARPGRMALVPCQSCFEGIKIAIRCVRWQISPAGSLNPWLTPH